MRLRQGGRDALRIAMDQYRHREHHDREAEAENGDPPAVELRFQIHVTLLTISVMLRRTRSDSKKLPSRSRLLREPCITSKPPLLGNVIAKRGPPRLDPLRQHVHTDLVERVDDGQTGRLGDAGD